MVVAGPSGVGKTVLIRGALERSARWMFSVSATTRARREGEREGQDYYFLSEVEFFRRVAIGGFLEYAEVYGRYYGTPVSELERAALQDRHLLIEVDTVGCLSIRALRPDIPLVAIVPPSLEELKRRLRDRGTETDESLAMRYGNIVAELQRMRGFDFVIVNDDLKTAQDQLLVLMEIVQSGLMLVRPQVDALLSNAFGGKNAK
jgi:guanylate kinase